MSQDWLFATIPFALGGIFFAVGLTGVRRTRALHRRGAKAYGQVVRLATSSGQNGILYHPVVQWTTADGRPMERTAMIGKSMVLNFRPGRRVLVHYDPRDPARMAIEGYGSGAEWLFCVLGALLLAGTTTVVVLTALGVF